MCNALRVPLFGKTSSDRPTESWPVLLGRSIMGLLPGVREVAIRDIRCLFGRHRWEARHNPEVEGPKGDYQTCRRCGEDKAAYEPPPKNMYRGVLF